MIRCIIGAGYGDEGKGLAADYFSLQSKNTLVVRHNGGAQSGHTVEFPDKRFIFHELSSGSFRGADTYWADTFLPDIYKLGEEVDSFLALNNSTPKIIASSCCPAFIDDVLVNMLVETSRGNNRHGSCGMGINEAQTRKDAGYGIPLDLLSKMSENEIYEKLSCIRSEYTYRRIEELGLNNYPDNDYAQMLRENIVLERYAEEVHKNLRLIEINNAPSNLFSEYDQIIFENGQGLRLDSEFKANWPHVTASRTGLTNVIWILRSCQMELDEVVYVTRPYLTKHGAGPLKNECLNFQSEKNIYDQTNKTNEWQGSLRYAVWEDEAEFIEVIKSDLENCTSQVKTSLFVTHLNETDGKMNFRNENIDVLEFAKKQTLFDKVYLSSSRYSRDVQTVTLSGS